MKIIEHEQGSEAWLEARLGCPSGSGFRKLINGSGNQSASSHGYINDLIAESVLGYSSPLDVTPWMQRGTDLEPEARSIYEFEKDLAVQQVGFCMHDSLACGIAPDGLVGLDGGLEIKCPKPSTHVKYLRSGKLPTEYIPQVMGCLWITEREWWDFMSYHPSMPSLLVRVYRDDVFIEKLEKLVQMACEIIERETLKIKERL